MSAAAAFRALSLPAFYRLVVYEKLESSNDEAKGLAHAGAPEGALVVACEQTAGRGRRQRAWTSPPGNLYCSLLLRPGQPWQRTGQLSFLLAVAAAEAVERFAPAEPPALKWPNDVLLGGRKLAGILLESESGAQAAPEWVVAGIGLNVTSHPPDLPSTCLAAEGLRAEAPAVLEALAASFPPLYRRWQAEGFAPIRDAWLARAHGLGQAILVRTVTQETRGVFEDLDADGALRLRLSDGSSRAINAGEVYFPSP